MYFRNYAPLKTWLDKCLKSPVSEDPTTTNMVNVPKHCRNLHHRPFIIFINHCQVNWVGKSLSYWHAKSWYCLLTHWLPMESVLFFIEKIWRYQFRCNYLRNKIHFLIFLLDFWNLYETSKIFNRKLTLIDLAFSKLGTPKT